MPALRFIVIQGPGNAAADDTAQELQEGDGLVVTAKDSIAPGFAFTGSGLGDFSTSKDFTAEATTDVFTSAAHGFFTGLKVQVSNSGGALPTGLTALTNYYVIKLDDDTFKLSTSLTHALQGEGVVNVTTNGTGTQTAAATDYSDGTLKNFQAELAPSSKRFSGEGNWLIGVLSGDETGLAAKSGIRNVQKYGDAKTESGVAYQWYTGTI